MMEWEKVDSTEMILPIRARLIDNGCAIASVHEALPLWRGAYYYTIPILEVNTYDEGLHDSIDAAKAECVSEIKTSRQLHLRK